VGIGPGPHSGEVHPFIFSVAISTLALDRGFWVVCGLPGVAAWCGVFGWVVSLLVEFTGDAWGPPLCSPVASWAEVGVAANASPRLQERLEPSTGVEPVVLWVDVYSVSVCHVT